jgi:hypothetical protein
MAKPAGGGLNCGWTIQGLTVQSNGLGCDFNYKRTNPDDGVIRIFAPPTMGDQFQEVPPNLILDNGAADCSGTKPGLWNLDYFLVPGLPARVELWQKQPYQQQTCAEATVN